MKPGPAIRALALAVVALPTAAFADAPMCTQAYEKAQEAKAAGHLGAALVHLHSCIDSACPKFIREDCARWLDQTEAALPTVVFAVSRDGRDLVRAEVRCDGEVITQDLDGKAIAVDPGIHIFSVRTAGLPPVERQLLIREGERNRVVDVEFHSPPPAAGEAPVVDAKARLAPRGGHGREYLTYGLAAAGILGITSFTVFAVIGNSQRDDLEHTCSPYCQASRVDSVKTKYVVADVSLGVGLIALGVATYSYFSARGERHDRRDAERASSVAVVAQPAYKGGTLQLSAAF